MNLKTRIDIICGVAGSGKTTHMNKVKDQYDYAMFHDEWVRDFFDNADPYSNEFLFQLFMLFPQAQLPSDINKENLKKWLFESPEINVIYSNAWKNKYVLVLCAFMKDTRAYNIVAECPFIDESLVALKKMYPGQIKITWINTSKDTIIILKDRNWSDERITQTISTQNQDFTDFKKYIDERI